MSKTTTTKGARRPKKLQHTDTRQSICETFDCHAGTLQSWIKRGCPHVRRGLQDFFDAGEVAAWLKDHPNLGGAPGRKPSPSGDAKAAAELRRIEALATRYEIDVAQRLGDLVATEDAGEIYSRQIQNAKNRFLQLPAAVCAQLEGLDAATIQAVLQNRITEILASLAQSAKPAKSLVQRVDAPEENEAE